jgi:ABC-type nitrate/sulfonate/bicarbonate transport system substrate-binding protein
MLFSWVIFSGISGAQTKMTIAYSNVASTTTGLWMAKEMGAFEKYGIEADLVFISSGPVTVQALIGGDLQVGVAASNAVVNAIVNGAPIIGVGVTANRPYHRLYVQPEIGRLPDLRGKTLGVTRFGALTDSLTRIILRRHALEGAVNVRQLGGTLEVGAAFQQRTIAGAVTADLRVPANVPVRMLARLLDLGIPYSMTMLTVARSFYRQKGDKVDGMLRAYTEGVAAINHHRERALKVIAKYSRLTDPKGIENHFNDAVTYLERVPRADPEAISTVLEFTGQTKFPIESLIDNTIADRLVSDGFIEKLYKSR